MKLQQGAMMAMVYLSGVIRLAKRAVLWGFVLVLLVYFGGSEGGNSMTKAHNVKERTLYQEVGYAVLALAYFGEEGIPSELDRISLNGVYQAIQDTRTQPGIDAGCVIVAGGSKGAELALLLAATYPDIQAVLAFAPSDVVYASKLLD